jgi:hypothetical protein
MVEAGIAKESERVEISFRFKHNPNATTCMMSLNVADQPQLQAGRGDRFYTFKGE